MSYNIDTWKTKKLDNFRIPVKEIMKLSQEMETRGWGKVRTSVDFETGLMVANLTGDSAEIAGQTPDGIMAVERINIRGEGSGTFYHDYLLPLLAKSSGHLEAVLVWEGGDSISRLSVQDGTVIEGQVEL